MSDTYTTYSFVVVVKRYHNDVDAKEFMVPDNEITPRLRRLLRDAHTKVGMSSSEDDQWNLSDKELNEFNEITSFFYKDESIQGEVGHRGAWERYKRDKTGSYPMRHFYTWSFLY